MVVKRTYLLAHKAGGTFRVLKEPGKQVTFEVKPFRPDRARPALTLAYALFELATYEKAKKSRRAWTRALALVDQAREAVINALQDDEPGSPDLAYRTALIDRPLAADAVPCVIACGALKRRLGQFFEVDEEGLSELDEDIVAIARARHELLCVFEAREVAGWVDDGQGGTLRERTDRVLKQRKAARKAADPSIRRFPQLGGPMMVVSSER